ncbi:MAG: CsbD family protein [Sandarakinorhabdus sp.]|nr:CsbD family protein [Sandarakinorhabdus sp.]
MGELTDKAKGLGNEIAGTAKVAAAKATDNPKLKGEGEAQKLKGAAQKIEGDVKGALGNKI